jgi:hypothetical protein
MKKLNIHYYSLLTLILIACTFYDSIFIYPTCISIALVGFIIYISNLNQKRDDRKDKEIEEIRRAVQNLSLANQLMKSRADGKRPLL